MKNRRSLKQAFVATVAAGATVAATGCFEGQVISNPPGPDEDPTCPTSEPIEGDFCFGDLTCSYESGEGCPVDYTCGANGWEEFASSCNPPPPECPAELPEAGAECSQDGWGYPSFCHYDVTTPCAQQVVANCVSQEDGPVIWELTFPEGCHSSPEACSGHHDPTLCDADEGCRWLVPGCAEGTATPPAVEGCYPIDDCSQTGCGTWGTCETVTHNPCWNDLCDACGAETNVCITTPP